MRIFFLYYEYDPRVRGGMGGFSHLWQLAKNWHDMGHRVTVFSPTTGPADPATPAKVVRVPAPPLPFLRPLCAYGFSFLMALREGLRHPPDMVYCREMFSPLLPLLARLLKARLFIEVNGDSYEDHLRRKAGFLRLWFVKTVQTFNFRRADRVLPVTEGLGRTLRLRYRLKEDRVAVIPNGTDTELFFPRQAVECRRALGLPAERPLVGFIGTFYAYQGLDVLLQAAPILLSRFPRTLFLLVGDGVERPALEDLARRLGIGDRVVFTGQVPYEEVPLYLGALDVVAAPFRSFRGETSPLKLMDAWACGRAVAASDIPALRPLKEGEEKWAPVPPDHPAALANALADLLANPARRERLGQAGLRYVRQGRTWRDVSRRILEHWTSPSETRP